jgi:Zn-dependent M28 family amino/carboxypeptidase
METRLAAIALTLLLAAVVAGVLIGAFVYVCIHMPGRTVTGKLPPPGPDQARLRDRLKEHVRVLAVDIGERNAEHITTLDQTADYIRDQFRSFGYAPTVREFGEKRYRNVSVEIHGNRRPNQIIVVGAHYDTVWGTPGADDNASGVAGLLEIARALAGKRFPRTVRLIAFCNEEEPFYGTDQMGSRVSAGRSHDRGEDIIAMFSLEMIGYYVDEPGSQRYPRIVRRFYPDRGNFIAFVSNLASRDVLHRAIAAFREQGVFPSEGMAAPEWLVPDIRRSDHAMYWHFGYPAVMVTDTSNYRNYGYHNMGDTFQSLNYAAMARVVSGLSGMIQDLAGEGEK